MERVDSHTRKTSEKMHQGETGIPNPLIEPIIGVERAGQILGIGRSKAYELAQTNNFPVGVLKIGRTYHVLTSSLVETLGLDAYLTDPPAVSNISKPQTSTSKA